MARVVDCWPSSDDDLPEVDALLKRPVLTKDVSKATSMNPSPQKELVPKSTSKPRRVRRLDGGVLGSGNILLQKFDSARDLDTPRKSPTKRRAHLKDGSTLHPSIFDDNGSPQLSPTKRGAASRDASIIQPSIFDEDDAPPTTARPLRFRRPRVHQSLRDNSEDDDSQPSLKLDPVPHISGLRNAASDHTSSLLVVNETDVADEEVKTDEAEQNLVDAQLAEEFQAISLTDETEGVSKVNISIDSDEPNLSQSPDGTSSEYSNGHNDSASTGASLEHSVLQSPSTAYSTRYSKPRVISGDEVSAASTSVLSLKNPDLLNHEGSQRQQESKSRLTASLFRPSTRPRGAGFDKDRVAMDLTNELSKLRLDFCKSSDQENEAPLETPTKSRKTKRMVSLTKPVGFPKTPHKPTDDAFWDQELVNDWNDQHSPRRPTLPVLSINNVQSSPKKGDKKIFDLKRHALASGFLQELDTRITEGKIGKLAESTGGVSIVWSKTLNTTAGRANWKRETIRTKDADGKEISVEYKHHASIELAEKVINDENRLLNVVAHEFCHLANFMINGITNNPHGKEFKVWAAKCSRAFSDRGIKVTTKHTYDIDYKYVWECVSCGSEYKRHSKSINPSRHRCGTCKDTLKQVKPVPRGGGKPSEYQVFVKEQMKIVRDDNPGSPQKDLMRIIADNWAKKPKTREMISKEEPGDLEGEQKLADLGVHHPEKAEKADGSKQLFPQIIDLSLETTL